MVSDPTLAVTRLVPTPEPTSARAAAVMRGNRRRDTSPELRLRKLLHAQGLRFRVDLVILTRSRRVRPDIVFPRQRVVVFVDGCFWHGCPEHLVRSRSNRDYWDAKLARNLSRDHADNEALNRDGWTVVRVWGHETADSAAERVFEKLSVQVGTGK